MGAPIYTCASYKETMEAGEYESKLRVAEARGVRGGAGDDEDDDWDRATGRCRASGGWPWVADEASASLTCPVSHVSAAVSTLGAACWFCAADAAALFGLGWNGSEQPSQARRRFESASPSKDSESYRITDLDSAVLVRDRSVHEVEDHYNIGNYLRFKITWQ
uniref:Uncharacterized protein n=1 Tax=Setaria italica TaxID=4555 RepID=K3XRV9_SETIT